MLEPYRQQLRSRSSATIHRYQLLPPLDGYFVDIPISNNPPPEFKQFMKWYTGGGAQYFAKDGYGLTFALELDIDESGYIYAKSQVVFFPPPNDSNKSE